MSISKSAFFYWAKSFSKKNAYVIAGIALSTDGALLIVHGWGETGFITIFNSFSGAVVSARAYSTHSYWNYNEMVKSLVVGSGAAAKAYVLSNF